MFCVNCGSALSAGAGSGAPPTAAPMYPGAMPGLPSAWDAERRRQIDRTKTGVLLILVGTLIGWLPYIGVIGFILIFVGAILVILGRKAFGAAHSRNVMISIVLVILGIIITVVAGVIIVFATISSIIPGNAPTPAAITSTFNNFLIILVVGTIVTGLASVFFTYAIQNQTGRMLLLGGYVARLVLQIAIFVVVSQAVGPFVAAMFPGGTYTPAAAAISTPRGRSRATGAPSTTWSRLSMPSARRAPPTWASRVEPNGAPASRNGVRPSSLRELSRSNTPRRCVLRSERAYRASRLSIAR